MKKGDPLFLYIAAFLVFVCLAPLIATRSYEGVSSGAGQNAERVLLELTNFSYKELSKEEDKAYVVGEKGFHYENRDEIYGFRIHKDEAGYKSVVSSKKALRANGETLLDGGVEYNRSDGYRLAAQKTKYVEKNKTLLIDSPFVFEGRRFKASGESSQIDIENKKVAINSVKAKLYY